MERSVKPEALLGELVGKRLIDVRRIADREASSERLPGAIWCDPEQIEQWSSALMPSQDIVIYCVRGGSVSNAVVDALHAKGIRARYIEGGIEGWKAAGGAVVRTGGQP